MSEKPRDNCAITERMESMCPCYFLPTLSIKSLTSFIFLTAFCSFLWARNKSLWNAKEGCLVLTLRPIGVIRFSNFYDRARSRRGCAECVPTEQEPPAAG